MATRKQSLPFGSFGEEVLIYGFIRRLNSIYHLYDIITIISYYHQQIPLFILNSYSPNQSMYANEIITCNYKNNIFSIYPHKLNPWHPVNFQTIILNNGKRSDLSQLQYNFSIQCIENMEYGVQIGIAPNYDAIFKTNYLSFSKDDNGYFKYNDSSKNKLDKRATAAYFLQINKKQYEDIIRFSVEKYYHYDKRYGRSWSDERLGITSLCKDTLTHNIISLNVDCSHWKLNIICNDEIIHTIDITENIPYIPVIWVPRRIRTKPIRFKVISMNSNCNLNSNMQTESAADIERYVYQRSDSLWGPTVDIKCSSKHAITSLWKGHRLCYGVSINENISRSRDILFIMEIYQHFYNTYIRSINKIMSDMQLSKKISVIISHYVIENYNDVYEYVINWGQYKNMIEWMKKKLYNAEDFTYNDCNQELCWYDGTECWTDHDYYTLSDYSYYDSDGYGNVIIRDFLDDKLSELAIHFNCSKDNYRKGHLYGDLRYKMRKYKHDKLKDILPRKQKKRKSYRKRKKDKIANYKSKVTFKNRYQLSLQY